ncbi:4-phytase/acid phosphatase [Luteibacter sp. Sphag1AF]|uniref:histidine-type phosphatase n=1 Tax=Luteibacter sp. Sphag1AF TaxID=2587031 RepID=UPI001610CD92|nr:histidine-type phosphatase [Luteibacter sp. Sphag1AF]MBB3225885.1 4-phytase/acid phosphatase [Luteibacter sp. Sphag1AF]
MARSTMKLAFALLCGLVAAEPALAAKDAARLEIVLMRHGVRSPTKPPETYAAYAVDAWPAWPVAPGMLTTHGAEGMTAIGRTYRASFAKAGLWNGACPADARVVIISDSTPRNRQSSAAFVTGLAPTCDGGFLGLDGDTNNPLFHYGAGDDKDAAITSTPPDAPAELADLERVMLNCDAGKCADVAGKTRLATDTPKAIAASMKMAGTLSENLMLSYVQGMPMQDVGWGRATEADVGKIVMLHNAQFAVTKKSQPAAAQAGSNLAAHMLASLNAAAGQPADAEPLAPAGTRAVVLMGHDTNLANIAGVLGLDWHDATRPDDYPPGGAVVIGLYEVKGGYEVRVRTVMPSLNALRTAQAGKAMTLVERPVALSCAKRTACTLDEFKALVQRGSDPQRVDKGMPALSVQHQSLP